MVAFTITSEADALRCPIRTILSKVTGKWQIVILLTLDDGSRRFGELKRTIGDITQRVLTENLKSLQRDGYLTRTVDPGPPVAVSYALTPQGESLAAKMRPLVDWAYDNMESIKAGRADFEASQS